MIPVILSGGSGTRLWPVSRQSFPKQFCELLDESLFVKTVKRLKPLGSPWTITVQDLKVLTESSLKSEGVPIDQVIYEPFGRNTAPAIALLCRVFQGQGCESEVVGIFPADQLIGDEDAFLRNARLAESIAQKGEIVTLGIQPTHPATGYGYIETSGKYGGLEDAKNAVKFREKPNEETASEFLEQGGFYWNAGIFFFRVDAMINLFQMHAPGVWTEINRLQSDLSNLNQVYEKVQSISIDYAVMERLPRHVCVPGHFAWDDLGSWDSVAEVLGHQEVSESEYVEQDSTNNFVFPRKGKTYATIGVRDLLIVDTSDALLISRKGHSEKVKGIVERLKKAENPTLAQYGTEIRPWGKFEVLRSEKHFKSKIITVNSGAQISYQSHRNRAEHWTIVRGRGEVVLEGDVFPVEPGSHIFIPIGKKHRIRNLESEPLEFIEVQLGSYFGEDDITRYDDAYGRI